MISIIAVLSTIAYVSFTSGTVQARDAKRRADIKAFEDSVGLAVAKGRSINYEVGGGSFSTGVGGADLLVTNEGNIRVLRYASAFQVLPGFVDSTILAKVPRDPKGSTYVAAFISNTLFQFAGTLESPETQIPEAIVKGTFGGSGIVDSLLIDIDNSDTLLPVGNADQFIRGDIIQIDSEKMQVVDISRASEMIIVTRGQGGTTAGVHKNRESIQLSSLATNAESLFCLGALTTLTKSGVDASGVIASQVPTSLTVTLTAVLLDDMYTCSSGGSVSDKGEVLIYNND